MKLLNICFLFLFAGISLTAVSQNYRTISPEKTYCYKSIENNEIKCLRIDSIVNENQIVYYPNHNMNSYSFECSTPFGASWIGRKIIISDNGDNIYFNQNNDSIRFKTIANIGDAWTCFEDDNYIITAEITDHDTLFFLGLCDSVKTIELTVYDQEMNQIEHQLNEIDLKFSKNYGWVSTLCYYVFPDLNPTYWDYDITRLYQLSGISEPEIGTQNLTWFKVFDFDIGDEIHFSSFYSQYYEWNFYNNDFIYKYIGRSDYQDSIVYTVDRTAGLLSSVSDTETIYEFVHDTITQKIIRNPNFNLLPDEPVIDSSDYTYRHKMALNIRLAKIQPNNWFIVPPYMDSCWSSLIIDGCYAPEYYFKGLGGPYYDCTNSFAGTQGNLLRYYNKGGETWGTPLVISPVGHCKKMNRVSLFPNPASNEFYIEIPRELIPAKLHLYSADGKLLMIEEITQTRQQISTENLLSGTYSYRIMHTNYYESGKIMLIQ
jgi:hypothetical protein